jgi:hypothetical protein
MLIGSEPDRRETDEHLSPAVLVRNRRAIVRVWRRIGESLAIRPQLRAPAAAACADRDFPR